MTLTALTERQREVAELVARGLTDKAIASELGISAKTVEKHVAGVALALHLPTGNTRVLITRRVLLCAA